MRLLTRLGRLVLLRGLGAACAASLIFLSVHHAATAGGSPERSVLLIDPADPDSLYLGQAYARLRQLPANRMIYMRPGAAGFEALVDFQGRALAGELAARGIADEVDAILIAPGRDFYVPIPSDRISTGCGQVSRISISSAYAFLPMADAILAGGLSDQLSNHYYGARFTDPAREAAFDAGQAWYNGRPIEAPGARRYYLSFLLGYTGERGNTVAEIEANFVRSAAADFGHPDGTFYFMNTSDEIRTRDRRRLWPYTVESIQGLGGHAEVLDGGVPSGRQDALGILTGLTDPGLANADLGIQPGAFADHLTSFAGMFDTGSQGKMSQWIAAGASGSAGTVEEPCTGGKFPDPDLHARYLAGMSLGEALFRSTPWTAFQTLYYGDPLTQPFANPPEASLVGLPAGTAQGRLLLTTEASAGRPGLGVDRVDVLVDGRRIATTRPGALFAFDTRRLDDGWHDLRLLAFENSALRTQGRWLGELTVANRGRSVELAAIDGPEARPAGFAVRALGGPAVELRLLGPGRILAAAPGASARFELSGDRLPAGPSWVQAEAIYADGGRARGRPMPIRDLPASGTAASQPLRFTAFVAPGSHGLIDLPSLASSTGEAPIRIVEGPDQASLRYAANAWMLEVSESATGRDRIVFEPVDGAETLAPSGRVELRYCAPGAVDAESLRICPGGRLWLPSLQSSATR